MVYGQAHEENKLAFFADLVFAQIIVILWLIIVGDLNIVWYSCDKNINGGVHTNIYLK